MATRDLSGDCTAFFNRYSCPILCAGIALLLGTLGWYANRIETKTEAMQVSLQQIEVKVGILLDRQPTRPLAVSPNGIAMAGADK